MFKCGLLLLELRKIKTEETHPLKHSVNLPYEAGHLHQRKLYKTDIFMIYFLQSYDIFRPETLYLGSKRITKMYLISKYKLASRVFIKKHFLNSHESNRKLSFSVGIGVFASVLPIWGFQTILALVLAFLLKTNKVISVAASNISQPPLTPFIIFISYLVGVIILGGDFSKDFSSISVQDSILEYVVGSIAVAIILAIAMGLITYLLLSFFRRNNLDSRKS